LFTACLLASLIIPTSIASISGRSAAISAASPARYGAISRIAS